MESNEAQGEYDTLQPSFLRRGFGTRSLKAELPAWAWLCKFLGTEGEGGIVIIVNANLHIIVNYVCATGLVVVSVYIAVHYYPCIYAYLCPSPVANW